MLWFKFSLLVIVAFAPVMERERERLIEMFLMGDTQEHFDKNIRPLTEALAKGQALTLHEGLPHQRWEKDLLDRELKAKKSILLHHFPFYEAPIDPKPADLKKLWAISSNSQSFERYKGLSMCCVFHPDWCLEWRDGDNVCLVLICFSCSQAVLYGPTNGLRTCARVRQRAKELAEILRPYHKNRPKPEDAK